MVNILQVCIHRKFSHESVGERILKIGPHLLMSLSNIKGYTFLGHSVVIKLQGFEFFVVQAGKSYSRPQKFQFWGVLPPKFRDTLFRLQKALPCAKRRVLSPHWSRSYAQCDLWPWQENNEKREKRHPQTVANWPFTQTTHVAGSNSKFACRVVYSVKFYRPISSFIKIGSVVLPLWVVENRPFPLLRRLAYTTACTTVQAVM